MQEADIVIVGGGPAGLAAAGALKKAGLDATILDKGDRIGGSWSRRYERLHLHTVRAFSGLPYLPMPLRFPRYVPKDVYAQYLKDYAERFHLRFILNCNVRKVRPDPDESRWIVESDQEAWRSRVVVVATGQFGIPVVPSWPGMADYRGCVSHSELYRTGRDFSGQRVLVVGAGNSGAEIAADLAEQGASSVTISIRTPPPIVPRELLGTPVQVFGIVMSRMNPRFADRIGNGLARLAMGDLSRYGIAKPAWLPFESKRVPIIDVGLIRQVKKGAVHVQPGIERFTAEGVVFVNGKQDAFDAVILATGFKTGLDQLVDAPGSIGEDGLPLGPQGEPTRFPGLFFLGFVESHRGHLFEANRASRRLAKNVGRYLTDAHIG